MSLSDVEKETLANENMKLVHFVAHKHKFSKHEYEEVFSAANYGFLRAINDFDPDRGVKFSTFAVLVMEGEIYKYYRTMNAGKRKGDTISLDATVFQGEDGSEISLLEMLPDKTGTSDWDDINLAYEDALPKMTDAQKKSLELYLSGYTQSQIAEKRGVSQAQISREIRKAFALIKKSYWEEPKMAKNTVLKDGVVYHQITKELYIQHKKDGWSDRRVMQRYGMHSVELTKWKNENLTDAERESLSLRRTSAGLPEAPSKEISKPAKEAPKRPDKPVVAKTEYDKLMQELAAKVSENKNMELEINEYIKQSQIERDEIESLKSNSKFLSDELTKARKLAEDWKEKYIAEKQDHHDASATLKEKGDLWEETKHELVELNEKYNRALLQIEQMKQWVDPLRKIVHLSTRDAI